MSITTEYIKNYLIDNKIIFPTNTHDNVLSGFQNYGPIGLKIKNNIIDVWRKIFIQSFQSNIFEIDAPIVLNSDVLERSGHIAKFNDLGILFLDTETQKIIKIVRADHYIEEKIQELNLLNYTYEENENFIKNFLTTHNLIESNIFVEIRPISLMYKIDTTQTDLYLRPEIAQSIFTEFKQFYEYNNSSLPFGIAQVGKSYRNEIASKQFVRLKEFTQAEIEYFYIPQQTSNCIKVPSTNEQFDYNKKCWILTSKAQINGENEKEITLNELSEYIKNTTLMEFVIKIYIFASMIGLDMNMVRFRQHKPDEMAHYSSDCWDLETKIFSKWLEVVGIADRGYYDLKSHDKNNLFQVKKFSVPTIKYKITPNKKYIFTNNTKEDALKLLSTMEEKIIDSKEEFNIYDSQLYEINEFKYFEMIYPCVIEPSIGIDRVFYSLIVHNLHMRENTTRPFLLLPNNISPYNFMLAQLSNHPDIMKKFYQYINIFNTSKYYIYTDLSSTTIGKRYTRADELGIIYSITIDFTSILDDTVTIRTIKTMEQKRIHINQIKNYI